MRGEKWKKGLVEIQKKNRAKNGTKEKYTYLS